MVIDSSGQTVSATYTMKDMNFLYPHNLSFSQYLRHRSRLEMQNQWLLYASQNYLERNSGMSGGRGIVIETPEIKSKAFKRMFGGGSIGLKVTGEITIDGNMRNERKSQVKTTTAQSPNTNFQMKQTQKFKVEGNIGENVSVFVDQDSERPFEFDNALKINYSSDEDGIVQRIDAGNVSLSLPGTRYVTFSSQSSGLFGIKSAFKVGGLDITAIASMEKGKKNTLTVDGGKISENTQIKDYQYRKNSRFFIHHFYRENYKKLMQKSRQAGYDPKNIISKIEVYKSDNNYAYKSGSFEAWAALDPESGSVETFSEDNGDYKGYFLRLDPQTDYTVNNALGYIDLSTSLSESEVLAVAFRDSSGTYLVGDIPLDTTRTAVLMLIKPQNPRPSDTTWELEWKNIYSLGTKDIDKANFELKMYWEATDGDDQESIQLENETSQTGYLELFGLDLIDKDGADNPDNLIDDLVIDYTNGLLIFPDLRPFDPEGWGEGNEEVVSKLPDNKRTPEIYDETNSTKITQASKFYITVNSASRSPNLSLGINVIEESEEVLLNGTKLTRDQDYLIDYFSGQLTLLNEQALDPTAKLQVNYESQQMFSIDKKTLLGTRAEYTLWETGSSRSFIGGTLLYLNQTTLDQKVRVGQQAPMRNIVWDVNTALDFTPGFIDKGLSKIPYLNAQGTSRIKFEGEIAQVIPNPNTLNNDDTGDHDGVAYLDDFESAKRDVSLGVTYTGWAMSSIPSAASSSTDTVAAYLEKRGSLYWYNPYSQVPIQQIWPEREVTTAYGGTDRVSVLSMVFRPNPNLDDSRKSWAGIMTSLSAGYADQEDSKFLEIWVKGDYGRLNVDLGWISEDAIPNRELNTEDKEVGGYRNGILADDEDTGIDGVFGEDPPSLFYPHEAATISNGTATPYDFWDLNGDSIKEEDEPWSYDDWKYSSQSTDYRRINGTENSKASSLTIYPNSEDLNGNSATDFINDYYEFSFSLEKDHPDAQYIVGGQDNEYGWRQYRIPLNKPTKTVGEPDWTRIRYARIWIDDVDLAALPSTQVEDGFKYAFFSIAEINLVGNEWKFAGIATSDSTTTPPNGEDKFSIEVINTHENAEDYTQPKGVEGEIDPVQKIKQREQSLVLKFDGLASGESGLAQKTFYDSEELVNYKRLKMFVHGGGSDHSLNIDMTEPLCDTLEFFLRLGSGNTTENYYEIRIPVYDDWDSRNEIDVYFEDFSRLKLEMAASGKDSIEERQANGQLLKISNAPSLSNIKWMIVGVTNKTNKVLSDEIWLDELRLSDVRKDKGMAMRARAEVGIADLFSVNGEYERRDADFHTVSEQFGNGSNSVSKSLNANVNIHKFLPSSLGISIPVSATYSQSQSTPKWVPGSDILVNHNTVTDDSLWEAIQTIQERKGVSVSLRKQTKSRNFFVRYLVDPFKTSFSYSSSHSSNSTQKYNDNLGLNGSLGYSLDFGNQNYIQPFKWVGQKGFLRKLSETKFFYLPTNISLDMRGSSSQRDWETRAGLSNSESTETYDQTLATGYKPFSFLDFDFSRSYNSDMRAANWEDILSSPDPGVPLSITQSAKSGFSPKLFSWFSPTLRVSSGYRWSDSPSVTATTGTGTNTSLTRSLTVSGNFDPSKFIDMFKKKKNRSSGSSSRTPSVRRPRQKAPEEKQEQKEETKEKKPFPLLKIFPFTGNLLSKINPISITYTITENNNYRAIVGNPFWQYQLGFSTDPKVGIHEDAGSNPITTSDNARLSLGSGLKITQSLSIDLRYEFGTTESHSSKVVGTVNRSSFLTKNSAIPFPTWSVSWRGLEKIKFLKKWIKQASLSHSFSGQTQSSWDDKKSNVTQTTYSKDFRPFLGLNMTLVNGMTLSGQYQTNVSRTETTTSGVKNDQKKTANSFTMNSKYSRKGGIKFPFMKGKKLENNIDFQLAFNYSMNKTELKKKEGAAYQKTAKTSSWSLKPQATYTFTNTVRGGTYFELGGNKNLSTGTTKITAFGINATISLAGR